MAELNDRPFPFPGEALQSYLCRLARTNRYSYQRFSEYYNDNAAPLRSYSVDDRAKISAVTQELCGEVKTTDLIDIWSYYKNDKELFDFARIKICPECYVAERNSISAKFWLKFIVSCDKHSLLLIDLCTTCKEKITFHSLSDGKCTACDTPIENMLSQPRESDGFSQIVNREFSDIDSNEGFNNKVATICHSINHQLKAALLLVNTLDLNPTYYWKKRRELTIEDLYQYQFEGFKFVENEPLLLETLGGYINDAYLAGERNLSQIFKRFAVVKLNEHTQFFYQALLSCIIDKSRSCPGYKVSIIWLESLLAIEKGQLRDFIDRQYNTLFITGAKNSIALSNLPTLLSEYYKAN